MNSMISCDFTKEFEADTLDDLFEILDDMDEIDQIDDQEVINDDTDEEPEEVNVEYVLIHNSEGTEVYRTKIIKSNDWASHSLSATPSHKSFS